MLLLLSSFQSPILFPGNGTRGSFFCHNRCATFSSGATARTVAQHISQRMSSGEIANKITAHEKSRVKYCSPFRLGSSAPIICCDILKSSNQHHGHCVTFLYMSVRQGCFQLHTNTGDTMARGQTKRDSRRRGTTAQSKMLQAILLGAAMGSTSAFVTPLRPTSVTHSAQSTRQGTVRSQVAHKSNLDKVTKLSQLGLGAAAISATTPRKTGLQMVSAGVERGMFTTSRPEDRRVTPEIRDGKAYFKVCFFCLFFSIRVGVNILVLV